jgi:hypothetical protein
MTTELNRQHRVAILAWEAACERLRASIEPHETVPPPSNESVAEALAIVRRALDALERAYLVKP